VAKRIMIIAATAWLVACGDDGVAVTDGRELTEHGSQVKYLNVDGFNRSYGFYIPASVDFKGPSVPVIMVLHGFPPLDMATVTGLNDAADLDGFIAVYPKANAGAEWAMACDLCSPNAVRGVADLKYLRIVVADLIQSVPAGPARICLTGFSNGGIMTYRGACELTDDIAAFAPIGAGMWTWHVDRCRPGAGVPIMMINGTDDPQFPWEGTDVPAPLAGGATQVPILDHVGVWGELNGCSAQLNVVEIEDQYDDGTTLKRWSYTRCSAETLFYKIEGGGHTWPSMEEGIDFYPDMGATSFELAATDSVVAFLLLQTR